MLTFYLFIFNQGNSIWSTMEATRRRFSKLREAHNVLSGRWFCTGAATLGENCSWCVFVFLRIIWELRHSRKQQGANSEHDMDALKEMAETSHKHLKDICNALSRLLVAPKWCRWPTSPSRFICPSTRMRRSFYRWFWSWRSLHSGPRRRCADCIRGDCYQLDLQMLR